MKRSPSYSCSSSSCSSCIGSNSNNKNNNSNPHGQSEKPHKTKRSRKCQINDDQSQNANSPSSAATRRSSIYRGVTRHRWTGRFEAHLWDKSSWNNIQNKKGRQVYLGAYDSEEAAARTYDLAALKYWGPDTTLNFPMEIYKKELEEMQNVSKEEYLASLRRRSSGFSRGVSKYRGVARHHHNGRWEARIGRVLGNKYLYLGTYNTQEEAAAAYDMAAIQYRGANAVTNFDISSYIDRLKSKGIHIDLPQSQEPTLHQSDELGEIDVEIEEKLSKPQPQEEQQQQQQQQLQQQCEEPVSIGLLQYTELSACGDSSTILDPGNEHDLPWNFYMDFVFNPLPVPNLPIDQCGNGLPDLINIDRGFEDNIDLIFEVGFNETEVNAECVVDSTSCGAEVDGNGQERLLPSTTSSPSSSTTSVSCNY